MAYDPTNTMTLRISKTDNPRGPKLWGVINIDGAEYKVSLWERTKEGEKDRWWSGPVEPKEERPAAAPAASDATKAPYWDDEVPF
jgi:hypothetical protein